MNRARLRLALLAILLLAFGLRLFRLDSQELRGDEAFGYFFSHRPVGEIVDATVALAEPHPVLSYIVQKGWLALAGDSEFALRFGGAWWGVLAVALLYRLARRLQLGPWTAALGAALLATNPYAIWHAQDARMYTMSLALTTLTVLLALEALDQQSWLAVLGYLLAALLALHTHYYAAYVILALNLFVIGQAIFLAATRPVLLRWLLWQLLLLALYLPWLVRAGSILLGYSGNGDSPPLADALVRSLSVLAAGESIPALQQAWVALAGGLLLLLGSLRLACGGGAERRSLALLALYLGVPLLATWLGAQARPIFNERYLVAALPPFLLLIAAAAGPWRVVAAASAGSVRRSIRRGVPPFAAVLIVLLVIASSFSLLRHYTDPAFSKTRGWRDLAAVITRLSAGMPAAEVRVAQNFPDPTLWYYYRGEVPHLVLPPQANDAAAARSAAQALAGEGVRRVLLPVQPAANWDAGGLAALALDGWFDRAAQMQVGGWPVLAYAQPAGALTPVDASFADGVTLRGSVMAADALSPGGLLTLHLDWTQPGAGVDAPPSDLKVFVQLLDRSGALVAQDDRPLMFSGPRAAGSGLAVYGLALPAELSDGPYRLITGLYDPAQAGAPRVLTADGADHVVLREF